MDNIPMDTFVFALRLFVFFFNEYLFVRLFCPMCSIFYVCVQVGAREDGRGKERR